MKYKKPRIRPCRQNYRSVVNAEEALFRRIFTAAIKAGEFGGIFNGVHVDE